MNKYCMKCHKTTSFSVNGELYRCSACYTETVVTTRSIGRVMIGNPYNCRVSFEYEKEKANGK